MPFTFKQFHIDDDKCGMRVSTDAVALGAWAPLQQDLLAGTPSDKQSIKRILDIGSGSGILSLMAAQRTHESVAITAVEIDAAAAAQSKHNVANSPGPIKLAC
ncbi:methyltransferase [Shewanella maritima]|uniref:methyltransferase n=1 Tax=Shewanella maritima TaxID=2520507 RepID=UPI00268138C7